MTIAEGHFQLYTAVRPALPAGTYRFDTTQTLAGAGTGDVRVDPLHTHVEVTSPRFQLPPDQVLSTFPPAGSEGAYGSRLPQVVIKRRTLPWEREVRPGDDTTPWLALVVVAEGEAELVLGAPVVDCVTPGVTLAGEPDVPVAAYLSLRQSMVEAIFPTRLDVPLLAHAREVDIRDTELMMGDDDGFLAVVVANRLPLAGVTKDGQEAPARYLAALVNLEGQLDRLLPKAPDPDTSTHWPELGLGEVAVSPEIIDHYVMTTGADVVNPPIAEALGEVALGEVAIGMRSARPGDAAASPAARAATPSAPPVVGLTVAPDTAPTAYRHDTGWPTLATASSASIYAELARGFRVGDGTHLDTSPLLRFPVLLHWSFTSCGDTTFESLMSGLDSGLLGTVPPATATTTTTPATTAPDTAGRPPVEVVETGHVGLVHRTRDGDETRAWYRGPLLPHPAVTTAPRLPLAHAADQLRVVIGDGREDLSLATAFEIGRLLALSQPWVVSALLRWRQEHFQSARRTALLQGLAEEVGAELTDDRLSWVLGRRIIAAVVDRPDDVIGPPQWLVRGGDDMRLADDLLDVVTDTGVAELVTAGLGLDLDLTAPPGELLEALREHPVPVATDLSPRELGALTGTTLGRTLERTVLDIRRDTDRDTHRER